MELGFYIGLGLWLTLTGIAWCGVTAKTKLDPVKLIVGFIALVGLPTFWGGVIEWAVT